MNPQRLKRMFVASILLGSAAVCRAEAPPTADVWSTYRMGGQPVGYIRETVRSGTGGFTTRVRMLVVINRLGNKVEIQADSSYEESADGQLQRARSESSASRQKTLVEAEIAAGRVRMRTHSGSRDYERTFSFTASLLGPEAARRLSAEKLKNPGDRLEYSTFSPEMQAICKITSQVIARETIELAGDKIAAIKIEQSIEGYPAKRTAWLDKDGRVLRQSEPGPFGVAELVRADRATAVAAAGGNELRGEMFDQTLVRSKIRLPSPRSLGRLRLELSQKDQSLGWPEFAGDGQTVISKESGRLVLEIRAGARAPRSVRPAADSPELHDYLAANAIVQSDDAEVRRLAREVVGAEMDTATAAGKLRARVQELMRFDLGIALAPASEVVRNRGGTCVAYSVLLAALLRAEGIPARIVMGYVYVAGIWGGHAWVEYRAGERWIPIDAALPGPDPCDAARLICFRSALRDGIGPHLGALLQLYGNVDIRTLEYDVDGRTVKVPASAEAYVVEGDAYRNSWLGIALSKPGDFRFGKMDRVYPDTTVVELLGPGGEIVCLCQESAGLETDPAAAARARLHRRGFDGTGKTLRVASRDAILIAGEKRAGLALVDRTDVWMLAVEGGDAPRLVEQIAANLQFLR